MSSLALRHQPYPLLLAAGRLNAQVSRAFLAVCAASRKFQSKIARRYRRSPGIEALKSVGISNLLLCKGTKVLARTRKKTHTEILKVMEQMVEGIKRVIGEFGVLAGTG